MDLQEILRTAVRLGASDVHLSGDSPPLARIGGNISELPRSETLTPETCRELALSLLLPGQRERFEEELELDCSIDLPGISRFRLNVLLHRTGVEAVFRVIPSAIPTPEELGLGPTVMSFANLPRGLVLVTGPAGCGKSTTLACLIDSVNQHSRKHIITIEDPIEFVHVRKRSLVRQREVGRHTRSFQNALRVALRQDPDVILIGELRDLETISLALTAAETGHLCLATLHTSGAGETIDRVIDVFPAGQQQQIRTQLAGSLRGVVSQLLLPRHGGGRIAAREVLTVTDAVSNLIREGKTQMLQNAIEVGSKFGMTSLDRSIEDLVRRGLVDVDEAAAKANDPLRIKATARSGQTHPRGGH